MWHEIHRLLIGIVRQWYKRIEDLLSLYYNDFIDSRLSFYVILFIVLIIVISLYYWIAWKKYEGEFIDSIQKYPKMPHDNLTANIPRDNIRKSFIKKSQKKDFLNKNNKESIINGNQIINTVLPQVVQPILNSNKNIAKN